MSTPISRNSKLTGLDLYAPRRVREQAYPDEQAASGETPERAETQQTETEQLSPEQLQSEQPQTEGGQPRDDQGEPLAGADCSKEADEADALDWVDQAIRTVIELEHASGGRTAPMPRNAAPQSPPVAPGQIAADGQPMQSRGARRQHYGDNRGVPPRHARLEPEIVPEPPPPTRRSGFAPLVIRFSAVIVFAAIVAYGLTMLSSMQPSLPPPLKGGSDRVAAIAPQPPPPPPDTRPPSRLVVADQQAFANQPLSLSLGVEHARDNELLQLNGLVQGTTLSAGNSTSPSSWQLPYDQLRGLYLYAPKDFVGVMKTAVDLLGPDKRLLDKRTMQLKWVAKEQRPVAALRTATAEANPGEHIDMVKPVIAPIESMDPGEAAMLMKKANDSLSTGDISAARVAFRRLADAGIANAAFALARTYDPEYLAAHNFLGMQGDRATARALYQRAKELGSADADRILARMGNN